MPDVLLWGISKTFKDRARIRAFGTRCFEIWLLRNQKRLYTLHSTLKHCGFNGRGNADPQCTHAPLITFRKLVCEKITSGHAAEAAGILRESVTDGLLDHLLLEEINFI